MKTALDTNIISALWSNEPSTPRLVPVLHEARRQGKLVLSPPVFSECLAHPRYTDAHLSAFLEQTGIELEPGLLNDVWKVAGLHYRQYAIRRRHSLAEPPRRLLADFLIGAHAVLHADRLLTLDPHFFTLNFPELTILTVPS